MSEKINVIFIITDQHRADHLSCVGNPILKTPNLDKLASEGVRFTSAYVANPICMPNRASIFTGLYPNMHGLRTAGMNLPKTTPTFTETLRENGYHTIEIGKIHLNWSIRPFDKNVKSNESGRNWITKDDRPQLPLPYYGFDEVDLLVGHGDIIGGTHYMDWLEEKGPEYIPIIRKKAKIFFGKMSYRTEIPENLYSTTYINERTITFLEKYAKGENGDKPFFLNVSYPDPHHPVCPPGKYFDMYKAEDIELPANFNDIENVKEHKFLKPLLNIPFFRGMVLRITNEKEARDYIAATYGSIAMLDDGIGQILTTLKRLNLADDTIVIYTSDHGDLMGDHGMILKGPCPYNGILNVPLIWKVPGIKPAITDSLASSIDISKTILNLLKIPEKKQPPDMQGVDLTSVLEDPSKKVRDHCLVEHDEEIEMFKIKIRLRHLITDDYKLTIYNGLKSYGDLFDRKNDPDEMNNLWLDKKYQNLRHELMEQLFYVNLNAQSRYPKREAMS